MEVLPLNSARPTHGLTGYESAINQLYAPMVIEPEVPGAHYEWSVTGQRCGMLGMSAIFANGEIRARVAEATDHPPAREIILTFVERGCFEFIQAGRHTVCPANSVVLMDVGVPLDAYQQGPLEILSFRLPETFLRQRIAGLSGLLTRAQSAHQGAAAILRDLMHSSWRESAHLGPDEGQVLPGMFASLIDAAFTPGKPALENDSHMATIHRRLQTVIEAEAHNPFLSPALIAARLGISVSYLFTVARRYGKSVRESVIERRLEGCRSLLIDPSWARRSITEIAFHWGFQDSSHFSRRFRERFGESPRAYRVLNTSRGYREAQGEAE